MRDDNVDGAVVRLGFIRALRDLGRGIPGGLVTRFRLGCGRVATLFYEPGGLMLRSCLIGMGENHGEHLISFQLGYLGAGEITVHVALEGNFVHQTTRFTTALLRGTDADDEDEDYPCRTPGAWLTYAMVSGSEVDCLYTVWGQPAAGPDDLRGELTTQIFGKLPLLTAVTLAGATRIPLPEDARHQPVRDWNQEDGSEDGIYCQTTACAVN